jgi:hypothetical protein
MRLIRAMERDEFVVMDGKLGSIVSNTQELDTAFGGY